MNTQGELDINFRLNFIHYFYKYIYIILQKFKNLPKLVAEVNIY